MAGARSLRGRALAHLARREHSASELRRKLERVASDRDDPHEVLRLLREQGLQSDERFVSSLVRRRAERFGAMRILNELREHGVEADLVEPVALELRASELARARAVRERRFGPLPVDAASRARQARFLAGRGFASEVVRKALSLD